MRVATLAVLATLWMLLDGCAIRPPVTASSSMCAFRMHRADVGQPPIAPVNPNLLIEDRANAALVLSGGGQHGAFGAGLLDEWKRVGGSLPRFQVVTAISTGAMAATFAFIGRPEVAAKAYAIRKESDLLRPFARKTASGGFTAASYLAIAKHGAVGDLTPLEGLLRSLVTDEVLARVAEEGRTRRLLVGAVDVDSGDAVIFDLTNMAERAAAAAPGSERDRLRGCYVKAIIASASVPLAAPPTFIDNREYIDGGARFGVFLEDLGRSLAVVGPGETRTAVPGSQAPYIFIIVNGTQEADGQCGKAADGGGKCAGGSDPFDNRVGAHAPWSLIPLAKRSSDILVNQVYRFSVEDIDQRFDLAFPGKAKDHVWFMPIVGADANAFPDPDTHEPCGNLELEDDDRLRPLEFHPHYMHCLIAYGRDYARRRSDVLQLAYPPVPAGLGRAIGGAPPLAPLETLPAPSR